MRLHSPRLVIAGLAGDSGKTLVALGIVRALGDRGVEVAPFKKGPDYIDAAWLGTAARRPGRNLDTFLHDDAALGDALRRGQPAELLVIEGNRGLFDGLDASGTHSTAELAKRLRAPVVLVVDVTKATRTVAALVRGCTSLDPELNLAGVILNRVATSRQERVIREAIAAAGGPPVLGALSRLDGDPLPGRHLGLLTAAEHPRAREAIERAGSLVRDQVDLEAILRVARDAEPTDFPVRAGVEKGSATRIAVLRDEAFSFYYPENLEALEEAGAELLFVSPLADAGLPEVDAVYVGGGFPEVHASRLAENAGFRSSLRAAAKDGLPIYAECGGLMYLAQKLLVEGEAHEMVGALDLVIEQTHKPCGHGYAEGRVERATAFFPQGARLRGHEFHYSRIVAGRHGEAWALALGRGTGIGEGRDGIAVDRIWASYLHVHALGAPGWAPGLVAAARGRHTERERQCVSAAWG